jgi:hypothetical protein
VQIALERGDLADWHRIATEIAANPWGATARQGGGVLSHSRPYGVAETMEATLSRARERAEAEERAAVAAVIRAPLNDQDSPRRSSEFASRIGTSPSRLSTYVSARVTPSATLMPASLA